MRPISNNEKWQPKSAELARKMIVPEWQDGCVLVLGLFDLEQGEWCVFGPGGNCSPADVPVGPRWGLVGLGLPMPQLPGLSLTKPIAGLCFPKAQQGKQWQDPASHLLEGAALTQQHRVVVCSRKTTFSHNYSSVYVCVVVCYHLRIMCFFSWDRYALLFIAWIILLKERGPFAVTILD